MVISAVCWLVLLLGWLTVRPEAHHAAAHPVGVWAALVQWLLMVGAMMLPLLGPQAGLIARRGLRRRSRQAVAAFVTGYLAVWAVAGLALLLLMLASGVAGPGPVVACLLAAAGWHCTPLRRAAVRQCGRVPTLALTGGRAHVDCVAAGALAGRLAVWTCGLAMSAMCFAHGPVLAVGVTGVLLAECRSGPNPEARIGSATQACWFVVLAGLVAFAAGWPGAASLVWAVT